MDPIASIIRVATFKCFIISKITRIEIKPQVTIGQLNTSSFKSAELEPKKTQFHFQN
jgi:hypothetical protein